MTHPIYAEFAEAFALVESKAHDYAEDNNVFSNFEFAASVAGVETEQVFAVLLGVKVARLGQLIGNNKVPNFESVADTLLDTMNYAGLLKAYMKQEAEVTTIGEAVEAALTEEEVEDDGPTAWEKHKQETEARWRAESEGYNAGESLDDGPVSIIGVGSIIKLKVDDGDEDPITYKVVEMNSKLASIGAVPTEDWEEVLGKNTRTFAARVVELA